MKNIAIVFLLIAVITLGAFCVHQQKQITQTETELTSVQNQVREQAEVDEKIGQAEQKSQRLQAMVTQASANAAKQSEQVAQLQKSLAVTKTGGTNPFAAMFKDPKMKEMIKSSQKAFMGPMLDKQYAALFQRLNLTPDQAATLKDLLQQKMFAKTDAGMSQMDDSLDASQRADLMNRNKNEMDGYNAQIQQFLGDENYSIFQNYEQTIPDRTMVTQFNGQLGDSATPLSDAQQEQLIQALNSARASFKWTTDFNRQNSADGNLGSFTADKIDQFAQETEQFNQQFMPQAQQILTAEQAAAFEQFQTAQGKLQIAGMKMAASMFAPKGQ